MDSKKEGVVKWFNEKKGFGFIECQGRDYFLHFKELQMDGYKTIDDGQKVTFNEKKTDKGFAATCVTIC